MSNAESEQVVATSLSALWNSNKEFIESKSIQQLVHFSGEGHLSDGNATSHEIRELLSVVSLAELRRFADDCLVGGFKDSGLVLQDIINQLGIRLGFSVSNGLYRGVRGKPGHDGVWTSKDEWALVVEVKTTDAYRINLDTVAQYREQLIELGEINEDRSSILVAVGRQDTGDLEAQIRGSRHAWTVRLISTDSLLRLSAVKEQLGNLRVIRQINQLLRPIEYTRVDPIVELLFETSQDIEESEDIEDVNAGSADNCESRARPSYIEVKQAAIARYARTLERPLVKKGRVLWGSPDGTLGVVCLASKRHDGPSGVSQYWFGFTPSQQEFLSECEVGIVLFVCADTEEMYAVPARTMDEWLPDMLTTPPDPSESEPLAHWHLYFNVYTDRVGLIPRSGKEQRDIRQYRVDQ